MNINLKAIFLIIFGVLIFDSGANAQQTDKNISNPLAMETILKQGPEYDSIKPLIGKWTAEMIVYKIGGREILSDNTYQFERKMMGNFLQETMTPMNANDPNPFQRMSYLNYNRTNRRWEYSVFDTRFPISMNEVSVESKIVDNSITVYLSNFVAPPVMDEKRAGMLAKQRRVITFGKDENTNEQYVTYPGEDEYLAIKYIFKRVK